MCEMGTFEKLMAFLTVLVFGLCFYVIFVVCNTEHITIKGITYYCEDNYSYYYEDLGQHQHHLYLFLMVKQQY